MKRVILLAGVTLWAVLALGVGALLFGCLFGGEIFREGWTFMRGSIFDQSVLLREENFNIADLQSLTLETRQQSIVITLTDGEVMTVRQYGRYGEDELFTDTRANGALTIGIPQKNVFLFGLSFSWPRLEVTLPRSYAAALYAHASSGSVTVEGHPGWGKTDVVTSSGSIRLEDGLTAGRLKLSANSGSIKLGDSQLETLDAHTTSGSLRLGSITASGGIAAQTSSGSLHCGSLTAGGDITLGTTSGSLGAGDLTGRSVSAKSSSGSLSAGNAKIGGTAHFSATSGSVRLGTLVCESFVLETNSGSLSADALTGRGSMGATSGSIRVGVFQMTGDSSARANSGSIRLGMAQGQNAALKLVTSSGGIHADKAALVYHNKRGNDASGTLGDGSGGCLTVQTGSGSIRIE